MERFIEKHSGGEFDKSRGHHRRRAWLGRRPQGAGDFTGQSGTQSAAMTSHGGC